jgi:ribonuclease PH
MDSAMANSARQGRDNKTPRAVEVELGFHRLAEGSALYRAGGTVVLATASVDTSVPRFMEGKGSGWITAEYQMHPRANPERREMRDGRHKPLSGRSKEIERLIGRALRSAVRLDKMGENTISIDCDVLEADGGTRTASITAAQIALALALDKMQSRGQLKGPALRDQVAAISVGHVGGEFALDLCYAEDSKARVDLNVVATAEGRIVEIQGTAEGEAVPRSDVDQMLDLALTGVSYLCKIQNSVLERAGVKIARLIG